MHGGASFSTPAHICVQERTIKQSKDWRRQIQEVDKEIYHSLQHGIKGGFDEAKFGSRIGFGNLKG